MREIQKNRVFTGFNVVGSHVSQLFSHPCLIRSGQVKKNEPGLESEQPMKTHITYLNNTQKTCGD